MDNMEMRKVPAIAGNQNPVIQAISHYANQPIPSHTYLCLLTSKIWKLSVPVQNKLNSGKAVTVLLL